MLFNFRNEIMFLNFRVRDLKLFLESMSEKFLKLVETIRARDEELKRTEKYSKKRIKKVIRAWEM